MRELLYRAQANDAYWHGLFGGLYLPHLRRAVYNAVVELEGELDRIVAAARAFARLDADLDGVEEVFVHNDILQLVARCDSDAAVIELDSYSLHHNFGDTLRRREEHYYRKMHVGEHQHFHGEGIASAHDRVSFKHAIAPEDVVPDPRPRGLFLDRWRRGDHSCAAGLCRRARGCSLEFEGSCDGLEVAKTISLNDNRVTVRYALRAQAAGRFETELNLAMPSCDGVLGRYVFEGGIPGGFGQPLELAHHDHAQPGGRRAGRNAGAPVQPAGRAGRRTAPHRVAVRGRLREDHAGGHAAARLAGGGGRQRYHCRARGASGLKYLNCVRSEG